VQAHPRETVVETGLDYLEGEPVLVFVRRRGSRYLITDGGRAAELAGLPQGWREPAERLVVRNLWLNVSRAGYVFVAVVEGSSDVDEVAGRVAAASKGLYEALLELE
jgi:hypothetical protein